MNRYIRRRTALAAVAAVLTSFAADTAAAQEPVDTIPLDSLVVTATRQPLPRDAVPAAVSVIAGDELRARGERLLVDALRLTPGTAMVQSGPQGALGAVYLRGGESDYVRVLVDGVPVNQPGGSFDFAHLRTEDVERIEIVRGPVSVLYGSDAVTGVIHVITRRGTGAPRITAAITAGRSDRVGPEADGASDALGFDAGIAGAAGSFDYAATAARYTTDGAYAFNNDYHNNSASARLGWSNVTSGIRLNARYTDGEYHYPTDGSGVLSDYNAFRTSRALTLGASVTHALTQRTRASIDVALHDDEADEDDAPDSAADTLGFYAFQGTTNAQRRSIDGRIDMDAGIAQLTVGAAAEEQDGDTWSSSMSQFGPWADSAEYSRSSRAAYAQVVSTPVQRVTLTAGSRIDDGEYGTFATWRAGVSVRPGAWVLRAAAGSAFKEPTFYENYARGFVTGNPDLDPERSLSYEVGVERTLFRDRARIAATAYTQEFEDLIQYTSTPAEPGAPNYFNLGAARARGLEVSANVSLPANLRLDVAYDWLDTEVTSSGTEGDLTFLEGERLLRRPEHRIAGSLQWTRGAASAWLGVSHAGERIDLDFSNPDAPNGERITLGGYTLINSSATVPITRSGWGDVAATLRIENVLDERYEEVLGFPARGRAVFVGAKVSLGG
ncbi:MAG TPA: TonB-dependent receptor [Longimicrobiales bacterium]|nr:TonB-dependent receptor [Longimicrobiales bacterium]